MIKLETLKDLLNYCEIEDTYVTGYKDGKCYLKNGDIVEFIELNK